MTLSFHIRHEVTPERSKEVFDAIGDTLPYQYVTQAERQEMRLRQLGLVVNDTYTENGKVLRLLCDKTPTLWGDLLHYHHYSLWDASFPVRNGFSWTYRHFADYLWKTGSVGLDGSFWDPVVAFLIGEIEASSCFGDKIPGATREGTVSLSRFSLVGALHWFRDLTPPVIQDELFARRHFCPPELALLALGWVAQTLNGDIDIDLLLTPERRESLCRVCLLDPAALDPVLDWMLPLYPTVVRPGTGAGVYGRFVRFLKWPELGDLLR